MSRVTLEVSFFLPLLFRCFWHSRNDVKIMCDSSLERTLEAFGSHMIAMWRAERFSHLRKNVGRHCISMNLTRSLTRSISKVTKVKGHGEGD